MSDHTPSPPAKGLEVPSPTRRRGPRGFGSFSELFSSGEGGVAAPSTPLGAVSAYIAPKKLLARIGQKIESFVPKSAVRRLPSKVMQSIPRLIRECVDYLEEHDRFATEYIFRSSGDTDEVDALAAAFAKAEKDDDLGLVCDSVNPHPLAVATLLKRYLMNDGPPLISPPDQKKLLEILDDGRKAGKETELIALDVVVAVRGISPFDKLCLIYFCQFLKKVANKAAMNKMGVDSLAVVFAPILMRVDQSDGNGGNGGVTLNNIARLIDITKMLIYNARELDDDNDDDDVVDDEDLL